MTTTEPSAALTSRALEAFWPDATPQNFVDGRWSATARRSDCVDPSTGMAYTSVPLSERADVDAAVEAARAAQSSWAALSLSDRISALSRLCEALADRSEKLALLESIDSGNPLSSTRRDMMLAKRYLSEWPAHALTFAGRASRPHPDGLMVLTHEPYGVVGRIIAYNHPSLFAIAGSIFPLLAGNTIVIKAAAQTPVATLALGALLQKALPPGVMNIVAGEAEAGDALTIHPLIKRVSFVGSGATALKIQSRLSVSGLVKHFTAELGGKNPMIVCPDVDLPAAVEAALAGTSFLVSQGQSCQSTARLLVHEEIHDEFVERLAARLRDIRVGPAYAEDADMGPLVSAEHLARVKGYVRAGIDDGAMLIIGGGRPDGAPDGGYYLEPTLFTDVPAGSVLASEEIFGPVAVVQRWSEEAQVVEMANDVPLGLSAGIWTKDIDRALRLAGQVRAGYVWVNDANRHYPGAPFGGQKGSGTGREESIEDFTSYLEAKAINIKVAELG
jgi:acyl-CoA reductase-like NAD-dependent aldehyde dehydrogenase